MTESDAALAVEPDAKQNSRRFFETAHLSRDLRRRSVRGGTMTMLAQIARAVLHMVSTICLARLLRPADFGLVAMVTAITRFVMMFKDLGLSMATVQRDEVNHAQVSTLFWVNMALSTTLCFITVCIAPLIAWFYGESRLLWITLALAITFIFGGLAVQHEALLKRQMRFRALGILEVVATAISIAVGIGGALLGWGYWSLVAMYIALPVATAIGAWLACPWRPGRPVRGSGVRAMLAFGGYLTGFNVVNYFSRNLDNVLIGWRWGPTSLGLYSKAYGLLLLPIQQVTPPISAVTMPALSRLQNEPERYRNFYLRALSLLTFVTTPLAIFLLVCAEEVIAVFLGPDWREAAPIFRLLGISAVFQPMMNSSGWLYMSGGRSGAFFLWGLAASVIVVLSFIVGLPHGPTGVALCYSLAAVLLAVPCMHFAIRGTRITLLDVFKVILPVLVSGALAAGAALALKLTVCRDLPAWLTLAICALVGGSVHTLVVFYAFNKKAMYLSTLNELRSRRTPESAP